MNKKEIYETALQKWGKQLQLVVAMEEMAELTKQLSKWIRGKPDFPELASEVADVTIMLDQVVFVANKEYPKFDELVAREIHGKLRRLEERMEE